MWENYRNLRSSFRIFWYPRIVQGAFASTTVRVQSLDGRKSCRPRLVQLYNLVRSRFLDQFQHVSTNFDLKASALPVVFQVLTVLIELRTFEKPNYRAELVQTIQHANMEPTWSHGAGDAVPGDVVRLEELCSFCHVCPPAPLAFCLVCSPGCDGCKISGELRHWEEYLTPQLGSVD